MKKLFTTTEVGKMCRASPGSVIRWIGHGKLKAGLTPGGHRRIERQEVAAMLDSLNLPLPQELKDSSVTPQESLYVLIADDEGGIRQLIRSCLAEQFPQIQVEEASDGFEAGWKSHRFKPVLVILDLRLPGLDGFQVCDLIRSLPDMERTRILAITGFAEGDMSEKILKQGANDFLKKPFEVGELERKLRLHLKPFASDRSGP